MIARTKYARVIDQIERRRDDCARLSKSFSIFIAYIASVRLYRSACIRVITIWNRSTMASRQPINESAMPRELIF